MLTESIEHMEENTDKHYEQYCSFCEKVVNPLFDEQHPRPEWLTKQMEEYERLIAAENGK